MSRCHRPPRAAFNAQSTSVCYQARVEAASLWVWSVRAQPAGRVKSISTSGTGGSSEAARRPARLPPAQPSCRADPALGRGRCRAAAPHAKTDAASLAQREKRSWGPRDVVEVRWGRGSLCSPGGGFVLNENGFLNTEVECTLE